jgi:dimethylhistidine N-methyltransferase
MNQMLAAQSNVHFEDQHPSQGDFEQEILQGLRQQQKAINPKFFYDAHGSALFEEITRLPEYYPTRTEREILRQNTGEISQFCGTECVFIEPGSGSSEKVRLLLDELKPAVYVPVDISSDYLRESAIALGQEFPWLPIHAICADFNQDWHLPQDIPGGKKVIFYPGSTIGNLEPSGAIAFLTHLRTSIDADGGILVGVDLHKSEQRLHAAYNDSRGITAEFNLNLLDRINSVLETDFDRTLFAHKAFYNKSMRRIEMHLVCEDQHSVQCGGETVDFRAGESIHTENSYKYTLSGFADLAASAGLQIRRSWLDENELFSVHYLDRGDGPTP